jgi:spore germination protein GerM
VRRASLLLGAVVVLSACGIEPQAAPEDVEIAPVPQSPPTPSETRAGPTAVLWFLRDGRLESVRRAASGTGPETALALLADGPTPQEAADGLTTALFTPQPFAVVDGRQTDTTVTVAVSPAFTSAAGENQLRAVAQVVFTVTEFDGADQVRFTTEDGALEVPTDEGLTDEAVDRDDYASLAPEDRTPGLSRPASPTAAPR